MYDRERQIADLQRYLDDWRRRWHRQHRKQEIRTKSSVMNAEVGKERNRWNL